MDEFEQRMSFLLEEAVPEPGHEIEIEGVRILTRSRHASMRQRVRQAARLRRQTAGTAADHTRRLAVAGGIAAAVAIAAGTYIFNQDDNRPNVSAPGPSATRTSVTTDPSELTSTSWQLMQVVDPSGTVPAAASAPVVFTFNQRSATDHVGRAAAARITPGRIELGPWASDLMFHRGPRLDIAQANFVYRLMDGTLNWSITGDTLALVRPGRGSLVFERSTFDAKQAYGAVSGRFMAVGGPAGVPSPPPIHGIGTVQFTNSRTGETQTVDTSTGGAYGTSIAAGTYTVMGYISAYQGGDTACAGSKPLVVEKGGTAKADLYCQER